MRTFMLLVLTTVAVTGLKHHKAGQNLLMEIMNDVDSHLKPSSTTNLNQFVKDAFPPVSCTEKHLCQAAMVMMNTQLNHSMLHRRLFAYADYSGHRHCNVTATEEHRMDAFLKKIKDCCKEQYSKLLMLNKTQPN
uniref:Interleukin 4 n=1 Tax=Sinocyclocheilus grahami TaxID=75366 RepID=A0A672MYF0_SINGR